MGKTESGQQKRRRTHNGDAHRSPASFRPRALDLTASATPLGFSFDLQLLFLRCARHILISSNSVAEPARELVAQTFPPVRPQVTAPVVARDKSAAENPRRSDR